jgi:hypothetical protein
MQVFQKAKTSWPSGKSIPELIDMGQQQAYILFISSTYVQRPIKKKYAFQFFSWDIFFNFFAIDVLHAWVIM